VQTLTQSGNKVTVHGGSGGTQAETMVDPTSVRLDGDVWMVNDAADSQKGYVFIGLPTDPMKPQLSATGIPSVMEPSVPKP
jgi:hypothetical protein